MSPTRGVDPLGCQVKVFLLGAAERPAERKEFSDDLAPFILGVDP
jgi:hypothetical protein